MCTYGYGCAAFVPASVASVVPSGTLSLGRLRFRRRRRRDVPARQRGAPALEGRQGGRRVPDTFLRVRRGGAHPVRNGREAVVLHALLRRATERDARFDRYVVRPEQLDGTVTVAESLPKSKRRALAAGFILAPARPPVVAVPCTQRPCRPSHTRSAPPRPFASPPRALALRPPRTRVSSRKLSPSGPRSSPARVACPPASRAAPPLARGALRRRRRARRRGHGDHDLAPVHARARAVRRRAPRIASIAKLALTGRVLGVSESFKRPLTGDVRGSDAAFVAGLLFAGAMHTAISGGVAAMPHEPMVPLAQAALAGFLVGVGSSLGNGCTSGHGICGNARLSPRSMAYTCVFMLFGFGAATLAGTNAALGIAEASALTERRLPRGGFRGALGGAGGGGGGGVRRARLPRVRKPRVVHREDARSRVVRENRKRWTRSNPGFRERFCRRDDERATRSTASPVRAPEEAGRGVRFRHRRHLRRRARRVGDDPPREGLRLPLGDVRGLGPEPGAGDGRRAGAVRPGIRAGA